MGTTFPELPPSAQLIHRNMGHGAAVGDYDNDGDLDVYLLGQLNRPNRLFRNNLDLGEKTFTEATPAVLANLGQSRIAHFVDLNNDGNLDLLLINDHASAPDSLPNQVIRNNGDGTWTSKTSGSNLTALGYVRAGCAIADFNQDGLLDIYITNWSMELGKGAPRFPGHNRLYLNMGDFVFKDVTVISANMGLMTRDSFTAIFTDFNRDRYPDIYVAVDHTSDEFYWNDAGVCSLVTSLVGTTHIGNDMGVAPADFDDDGDLDLYATNVTDPTGHFGSGQGNVFYENKEEESGLVHFLDQAKKYDLLDTHWGWGVEWLDIENDGDLDLVAVNGMDEVVLGDVGAHSPIYKTASTCFINDGNSNFNRTTVGLADDSRCLIAFDYDRDGDLDLLITNVNQPVRLLENTSTNQGHWLGVALGPDRYAIGAKVYATIGSVTKRRDIIAGRSYLAGTPSEVHFGLGAAAVVDELRVVWADGNEMILKNVAADKLLRFTR